MIECGDDIKENSAVIVDLPGADSVLWGLALAKFGLRPIPTYNGTMEQINARATTDNQTVSKMLELGANMLADMEMEKDARPAFLLDKNRLQRYKLNENIFDNSYDIYPQDLPTADYFLDNGIKEIVVVCDSLSKDLKKILKSYKKKNLSVKEVKRFG